MEVMNRASVGDGRLGLLTIINQELKVRDSGLFVVLDDSDYEGYPNPIYRLPAYSMNISVGGREEASPRHILDVIDNPDCELLVWLSKRICESGDIRFSWVYAHEIEHLIQSLDDPELSIAAGFLSRNIGAIDPSPGFQIELPAELDAELAAKRVVTKVFGVGACQSYINSEREDPRADAYYEGLQELEQTWTGDLREATRRFIRERESTVRRVYDEPRNLEFGFDLDALLG